MSQKKAKEQRRAAKHTAQGYNPMERAPAQVLSPFVSARISKAVHVSGGDNSELVMWINHALEEIGIDNVICAPVTCNNPNCPHYHEPAIKFAALEHRTPQVNELTATVTGTP